MGSTIVIIATLLWICGAFATSTTRFHPEIPKKTGSLLPFSYPAGEIIPSPFSGPDSRIVNKTSDLVLDFAKYLNPCNNCEYNIKSLYRTTKNQVTHAYLRQVINGYEVANADININFDSEGRVLSYGETTFRGIVPKRFHDRLSPMGALFAIARHLNKEINVRTVSTVQGTEEIPLVFQNSGVSLDDIPWKYALFQTEEGKNLSLAHNFVIREQDHWWDVYVDASSADVLALFDWVSDSQYSVYGMPNIDPSLGGRVDLLNPENLAVLFGSPLGWNCQDTNKCYTTTIGNNVYAQTNPTGGSTFLNNYRPDGGKTLNFNFPIDFTLEPEKYKDAAVSNLFYWNNIIHDIFYAAGFNEAAGNFQENNFGKGGLGVDAVQANAQDGSGYNNANFATPPDGQRPRMRMYLWNAQKPMRDGDLDSGIIVHEYGHGISTRLTGGPANSNCLQSGQAGGMGEGWGDFWAICFQMKKTSKSGDSYPMGVYANWGKGIRFYPYSTDFKIDPQTFGFLNDKTKYAQVHAIGSVWATILHEVYWELTNKYGFDPDWYVGTGGNNIVFLNVVDGLKLQPCKPSFVDARNAILLADTQNNGGVFLCDFWRGFARRGLGAKAVSRSDNDVTENFDLPPECL